MTFGFQTVTLVRRVPPGTPPPPTDSEPTQPAGLDDLGTYPNVGSTDEPDTTPMTETLVDMPGCTHRPLRPEGLRGAGMARAEETPAVGVSAAIIWWRTTVPIGSYSASLRAQVLTAQASDLLRYGGDTYQIITEPEPHPDFNNPGYKLTFTSEKQTIGT